MVRGESSSIKNERSLYHDYIPRISARPIRSHDRHVHEVPLTAIGRVTIRKPFELSNSRNCGTRRWSSRCNFTPAPQLHSEDAHTESAYRPRRQGGMAGRPIQTLDLQIQSSLMRRAAILAPATGGSTTASRSAAAQAMDRTEIFYNAVRKK